MVTMLVSAPVCCAAQACCHSGWSQNFGLGSKCVSLALRQSGTAAGALGLAAILTV